MLLPFTAFSQEQRILEEDYSFLVMDGEVNKFRQRADTLYELNCHFERACQPVPSKYYRILTTEKKRDFTILKMERLQITPITGELQSPNRYYLTAFKTGDKNHLGYLPLGMGLTKQELDDFQTDADTLEEKFFYTYFSETRLKEISTLKKITTKTQAEEIIQGLKNDKFKIVAEKYKRTQTWDMYGSGFSAEILNHVCIELGYNPLGAGLIIDEVMKQ